MTKIKKEKFDSGKVYAQQINEYCDNLQYFWAAGLIKASLNIWKLPVYRNMLNETGLIMVKTYEQDKL